MVAMQGDCTALNPICERFLRTMQDIAHRTRWNAQGDALSPNQEFPVSVLE